MSLPNIPVAALLAIENLRPGTPLASSVSSDGLLPQVNPGQVLSARVDAVLPDGNFRVTVANQPVSMALPKYFAPGDTLQLIFLARDPRLTFALSETPQAPAAPVVSAAGRMVASVLPRAGEAAMPATVANAAPLLAAAPENGVALSEKLQATLTQSGLFYESHQAEWVAGKRDLALLAREPQARLLPETRIDPQTRIAVPVQQQASSAQQLAATPATPAQTSAIATAAEAGSAATAVQGERAMPQQAQALVQQQLAALETGRLVFQLQVWPEQWMRWEIEDDTQQAGPRASDAPPSCQTHLHLDLPRLGALDATLSFDAAGVRVRLQAASASSAELLQDNRASLRAALADAGISSVDIAVARHGTA
jgi:flagellar hook-length control protein FliK